MQILGGLTHALPDHHRQDLYPAQCPTHDRIAGARRTKHILQDLSSMSTQACRSRKKQAPAGPLKKKLVKNPGPGQTDRHRRHSCWSSIAATYSAGYVVELLCPVSFPAVCSDFVRPTYMSVSRGPRGPSPSGRRQRLVAGSGHEKHRGSMCRVGVGYKRWLCILFRPHEGCGLWWGGCC